MAKTEVDLLNANRAFYAIFTKADYSAMDALWARVAAVSCIHPGWPPICGRDEVMSTWKGILRRPSKINAFGERATIVGDVGLVIGFESLGNISLVATNVFAWEEGGWKMIHHQAGVAEHATAEVENAKERNRLH
jgi:SnoaL-like protein